MKSSEEMRQHLLANRTISGDCWEWTKAHDAEGYGWVRWGKKYALKVHRVAASLWMGFDLNDKRLICHHCDNPKCFNPSHLFIGNHTTNALDCVKKKRHFWAVKTHCQAGHEYSQENTWIEKTGRRHCRTCDRRRMMIRYYMRREVEK